MAARPPAAIPGIVPPGGGAARVRPTTYAKFKTAVRSNPRLVVDHVVTFVAVLIIGLLFIGVTPTMLLLVMVMGTLTFRIVHVMYSEEHAIRATRAIQARTEWLVETQQEKERLAAAKSRKIADDAFLVSHIHIKNAEIDRNPKLTRSHKRRLKSLRGI
tara:strand:- start:13950 stop:14426 length:477 start_codon:yes stop_codon:yes gene_type:complete